MGYYLNFMAGVEHQKNHQKKNYSILLTLQLVGIMQLVMVKPRIIVVSMLDVIVTNIVKYFSKGENPE